VGSSGVRPTDAGATSGEWAAAMDAATHGSKRPGSSAGISEVPTGYSPAKSMQKSRAHSAGRERGKLLPGGGGSYAGDPGDKRAGGKAEEHKAARRRKAWAYTCPICQLDVSTFCGICWVASICQ